MFDEIVCFVAGELFNEANLFPLDLGRGTARGSGEMPGECQVSVRSFCFVDIVL